MAKKEKVDREDGLDWSVYIDEKESDNGEEEGMREVYSKDISDIEALLKSRGKKLK